MCRVIALLFPAVLALSIPFITCSSADAQPTRSLNDVGRRIETINRQAKDFERDDMTRDAKKKNDPDAAKRTRQIRTEIEEDLNSLQTAYNTAAAALQGSVELRPGFASDTGRTVRKHATRLRDNLGLPVPDEKEAAAPASLPDTERKTLTALCRSIYELVTNPMFDGAPVLDLKHGTKARVDLDTMIRLAEHLSGSAEPNSR